MSAPRTLYQKIWDDHVVEPLGGDKALLRVDRELLYEMTSYQAFQGLKRRGLSVHRPRAALAVPDHLVPTHTRDRAAFAPYVLTAFDAMVARCAEEGIPLIPLEDPRQGIVHVIGAELGFTQPGLVMVCCDSHTCTNGALGAMAFGIGSSEFEHVLATQTIVQDRLRTMRITLTGDLGAWVYAKDVVLHVIGTIGHDGGLGHAIEFAGGLIDRLPVEARMTICNMAIEAGSRVGMIAPDDVTIDHLRDRPMAPRGAMWDAAEAHWRTLPSDPGAVYDRAVTIDVGDLAPQVTWGTNPGQVCAITDRIPDPGSAADERHARAAAVALDYMDLAPGTAMQDVAIDRVFIGSCTNARLDDLRAAARIAKGRRVAAGVHAMVAPGSSAVRAAAEREGLDRIFIEAGFEWRLAGCSMCVGSPNDSVAAGQRCASTSNRNFQHRQGTGARTHLMSPAMVAATAIHGRLTDPRELAG